MSAKKTKIPRAKSEWEERFALQLRLHKIEYEREYQFAKPRKWRADFFIVGFKADILVEIEGGIWNRGRHNRGSGFQNDCLKYNASQLLGYKLLRGTPEMVRSGLLLEQLKELL